MLFHYMVFLSSTEFEWLNSIVTNFHKRFILRNVREYKTGKYSLGWEKNEFFF